MSEPDGLVPPRWSESQHAARAEELHSLIKPAVYGLDASLIEDFIATVRLVDLGAMKSGNYTAVEQYPDLEPIRLKRVAIACALNVRPLATWPRFVLPEQLRGHSDIEATPDGRTQGYQPPLSLPESQRFDAAERQQVCA